MSVHHKYTKDFKEKIENLIKFEITLYLIFDYPYKYYTFKHFEV